MNATRKHPASSAKLAPVRHLWRCFGFLSLIWLSAPTAAAATAGTLESHLQNHCFRCHGEKRAKGGLNLQELVTQTPLIKHREQWSHVVDLIKSGEMPPEDEDQPKPEDREALLAQLDQALNHFDYSQIDNPGFEPARRLTNQEYNHTVSDLFGLVMTPADRFPTDLTGASGFDNSANTLFLEPARMERYIAAAERVVDEALPADSKALRESPAFERVFIAVPGTTHSVNDAARQVIEHFLLRAYRRPPTEAEIVQALNHFQPDAVSSDSLQEFVSAFKRVAQATLISPHFLYRIERGQDSEQSFRITAYELASRLSYFLWSSMPDDALFEAATNGQLGTPAGLRNQVQRMLEHPKAKSLGSQFAAQWLGFQFMGNRVRLDPIDNPWCTDTLMTAMREESGLFFASLIQENRPLDDLINANYTYLNEELAQEIYDIDTVKGSNMRRVALNNPNRAGILTHGSLMAITSNYKETSPIKRGNWILETVLGRPLPPPPPNAGAFKEEVEENDSLTFREKVQLHSSDPSCRTCHSKIDPLGFSLENFDYFGRWRDNYRVRRVERDDEFALELVTALRSLEESELQERIADLDAGPDTRKRIQERLQHFRSLSPDELEPEITETLSASEQNRLIRILDWLEIDPDEGGRDDLVSEIQPIIQQLRQLPAATVAARLADLDLDDEEKAEVDEITRWLRNVSETALEARLAKTDHDELEGLMEIFYLLRLLDQEEESEVSLLALVRALRELDEDEMVERVNDLEESPATTSEIINGFRVLRRLPEANLATVIETQLDEERAEEIYDILAELDLLENEEDEDEWEGRRSEWEKRPITAAASLPDGTPFQGPAGLRQVILSHHRDDLAQQVTRKMLAYGLGRQLEYYDEAAIRSITEKMASEGDRFHALIFGIVQSYPFQFKKNPEPNNAL